MNKRGFFGIGIFNWQTEENLGTLWRSANNMGADFLFTVGRKYTHQCSDTMKTTKHIPYYNYTSLKDFEKHKPLDCYTVCVELDEKST